MKNEVKSAEKYEAEITELKEENTNLKDENAELRRQLNNLKRMAFGQKSEKRKNEEIAVEQISLFNEAEKEQSVNEREEEKSIVVNGHSRKKKRTRDEIFNPCSKIVSSYPNKSKELLGADWKG